MDFELNCGEGRTRLFLEANYLGHDLVIRIFNESAHIGAVAIGEYDKEHARASVSILTRVGHKDDVIAQKAAHALSHATRRPVCVIAGVHLDNITSDEINKIIENAAQITQELIKRLEPGRQS